MFSQKKKKKKKKIEHDFQPVPVTFFDMKKWKQKHHKAGLFNLIKISTIEGKNIFECSNKNCRQIESLYTAGKSKPICEITKATVLNSAHLARMILFHRIHEI